MAKIKPVAIFIGLILICGYATTKSYQNFAQKERAAEYLCSIARMDQRDIPERKAFIATCEE